MSETINFNLHIPAKEFHQALLQGGTTEAVQFLTEYGHLCEDQKFLRLCAEGGALSYVFSKVESGSLKEKVEACALLQIFFRYLDLARVALQRKTFFPALASLICRDVAIGEAKATTSVGILVNILYRMLCAGPLVQPLNQPLVDAFSELLGWPCVRGDEDATTVTALLILSGEDADWRKAIAQSEAGTRVIELIIEAVNTEKSAFPTLRTHPQLICRYLMAVSIFAHGGKCLQPAPPAFVLVCKKLQHHRNEHIRRYTRILLANDLEDGPSNSHTVVRGYIQAEEARHCAEPACPNAEAFSDNSFIVCPGCGIACYCSNECQQKHAPLHQDVCKQ